MPGIVSGEIGLYESLSMGGGVSDGGGMSGNAITSGSMNNVFPNISRADRTTGQIQVRKIFAKCDNDSLEVYSGAHMALTAPTEDETINVVLIDTAGGITSPYTGFWDTVGDALDYIEDYFQDSGVSLGTADLANAATAGDSLLYFLTYNIATQYGAYLYSEDIYRYEYTLDVRAGDCIYISEGANNEYAIVSSVRQSLSSYSITATQKVTKCYTILELKSGLTNSYTVAANFYKTTVNPDWRAYGYMRALTDYSIGDTSLSVESTRSQIVPVIYVNPYISGVAVYSIAPLTSSEFTNLTGTTTVYLPSVSQNYNSSSCIASYGVKSYTKTVGQAIKAGSVNVKYINRNKWLELIDEGDGTFTSDSAGSGYINSTDGIISVSLSQYPTDGSYIIFTYQLLVSDTTVQSEKLADFGAFPLTVSFDNTNITKNSIRMSYNSGAKQYRIKDDGLGNLVSDRGFYGEYYNMSTPYNISYYQNERIVNDSSFYFAVNYGGSPGYIGWTTNGLTFSLSSGTFGVGSTAIKTLAYNNDSVSPVLIGASSYSKWWIVTAFDAAMTPAESTTTHTGTIYSVTYNKHTDTFISCGSGGQIWTSDDGTGDTWTQRTSGTASDLYCVYSDMHSSTSDTIIAVGASGTVLRSDDAGLAWASVSTSLTNAVYKIWYDTTDSIWAICGGGGDYAYSSDDGVSWGTFDDAPALSGDLKAISSDDLGHWYIGGTGYVAFTDSINNKGSWTKRTDATLYSTTTTITFLHFLSATNLLLANGFSGSSSKSYYLVSNYSADITGAVDYITGEAELSAGPSVDTDVYADLYLIAYGINEFWVTTSGNMPLVSETTSLFSASAIDIGDSVTTLTIEEDFVTPGELEVSLTGAGSGTLYKEFGVAHLVFSDPVYPETLKISYYFKQASQYSNVANIDENRLPLDGKVSVVEVGDLCVITDRVNYDMGVVVSYSDTSVQLAGALNHDYVAADTVVSTCIYPSDLVADEALHFGDDLFSAWSDTQLNGDPDGSYDWTNYPMTLSNLGATTERWYIKIKDVSSHPTYLVDVIGENLGTIETDISTGGALGELAPVNPISSTPYWTLSGAGWDDNWKINEILRFNTEGAMYPMHAVRVINAESSDTTSDSVILQIRGDVSA